MPITRLIRLLLVLVALGFLVWKYAPWPIRTLVFKEQNCQCQVPWNWTLGNSSTSIMRASRPYGGSFSIVADPLNAFVRVNDPGFAQTIKSRFIADGHEILNESSEPFEGHPAYAYTMRKTINGKLIYTHSINFIAGKFLYDLVTTKKDADPAQDSQLHEAVDSFSLINPD